MTPPRSRMGLSVVQPVTITPAAIVISAPSAPPPALDDILGEILARLRTYALSTRVEIAVRVATFHASTSPDLASAWRRIEMAQVVEALLSSKGSRLVGAGTTDALRAEVAAQHAAAAEHIEASRITNAEDAWPPRPN